MPRSPCRSSPFADPVVVPRSRCRSSRFADPVFTPRSPASPRLRGMSTWHPRRCRDPPPRKIRVCRGCSRSTLRDQRTRRRKEKKWSSTSWAWASATRRTSRSGGRAENLVGRSCLCLVLLQEDAQSRGSEPARPSEYPRPGPRRDRDPPREPRLGRERARESPPARARPRLVRRRQNRRRETDRKRLRRSAASRSSNAATRSGSSRPRAARIFL